MRVSIPYRCNETWLSADDIREMENVSIPYRCNETAPKTYGGMGSFLFQFLIGAMRLDIIARFWCPEDVSIPYRCNETYE